MHWIERLAQQQVYSPLDIHLAQFMVALAERQGQLPAPESLYLATLAVSRQTAESNACAHLPLLAGQVVLPEQPDWCFPSWPDWEQQLRSCLVVGFPGEYHPLILDEQGRLYLYRYWHYEQQLATGLKQMLATPPLSQPDILAAGLQRLFPTPMATPDWQQLAATTAVLNRFAIVSGGPGTGKTTTVLKILALLLEQGCQRLVLAAPTGKAAARLKEAIRQRKNQLMVTPAIRQQIPEEALTLHRLLGYQAGSIHFRHNKENPLPYDVVVVDEASMIDLALMAKLVDAIAPTSRLILLGDRDQLASVEAGSVLGDLCQCATSQRTTDFNGRLSQSTLAQAVVVLQHSHRFNAHSGVGQLARAIQQGHDNQAVNILKDETFPDVTLQPLPTTLDFDTPLGALIEAGFTSYLSAPDPETALQSLEHLRVLCARRRGPWGVVKMNHIIEQGLGQKGWLLLDSPWYHRRPVLITSNDYRLHLFNGDLGVVWRDSTETKVWFRQPDQSLRAIAPQRLPAHETAWAMTVHKSQGSECEQVVLLLGTEPHALLTRELVYTAVTRARQTVYIGGDAARLQTAIQQVITRHSGLQGYFR